MQQVLLERHVVLWGAAFAQVADEPDQPLDRLTVKGVLDQRVQTVGGMSVSIGDTRAFSPFTGCDFYRIARTAGRDRQPSTGGRQRVQARVATASNLIRRRSRCRGEVPGDVKQKQGVERRALGDARAAIRGLKETAVCRHPFGPMREIAAT
ncbi:hypothetical protein [Streptomyces mirabilis]|uniref:hypothetical protein n=1 Tax=Streptomyces mirabilis TaxID=68239 RepID=UPI003664CBDB